MTPDSEAVTPIGVDRGEDNLYVACPVEIDDWSEAYGISGRDICARVDQLRDRVATLLATGADRETIVTTLRQRRAAIIEQIDAAARRICEYASGYDRPVLVAEDTHHEPDLWAWLVDPDAHRGSAWLLATAYHRLRAIAAAYAIEVVTVSAVCSSIECHACGTHGDRITRRTLRCTRPDCHVTGVHIDCNAAKVLAGRYCHDRHQQLLASAAGDRAPVLPDGGTPD